MHKKQQETTAGNSREAVIQVEIEEREEKERRVAFMDRFGYAARLKCMHRSTYVQKDETTTLQKLGDTSNTPCNK